MYIKRKFIRPAGRDSDFERSPQREIFKVFYPRTSFSSKNSQTSSQYFSAQSIQNRSPDSHNGIKP